MSIPWMYTECGDYKITHAADLNIPLIGGNVHGVADAEDTVLGYLF